MTYWTLYNEATGTLVGCCIETTNTPRTTHLTPQDGEVWLEITQDDWDKATSGLATGVVDGKMVFKDVV